MPAAPSAPLHAGQEDKQLKSILATLKRHSDVLPPEVQAIVSEAAQKEGQNETKQLHSAVSAHGKAKRSLQEAQLARHNLHAAWRSFLTNAVQLWQTYSTQFEEQEQQMLDKVTNAMQALKTAKSNLAQLKASAGADSKDESMAISDDEVDKDITGATATKIKEGITSLHQSLQQLQTSAELMAEEEQHALKRPRIEKDNAEMPPAPNKETGAFP